MKEPYSTDAMVDCAESMADDLNCLCDILDSHSTDAAEARDTAMRIARDLPTLVGLVNEFVRESAP